MKLKNILQLVNQFEKSKFISNLERIYTNASKDDKKLSKTMDKIDGQIKNASETDISDLFHVANEFVKNSIKEQLLMSDAQSILLMKILSRDGNSVARISWIESLYIKELDRLSFLSKEIKVSLEQELSEDFDFRDKALKIYYSCMKEAYNNDYKHNRDLKITDDERNILNILAYELGLTIDECTSIEHLVNEIPKDGINDAINNLRDMGLIFISKKRQEIFIPDEIVTMLNHIQGKSLPDKLLLRILRTLSDSELSNVLKAHNRRIRGISRSEKIENIIHLGIKIEALLMSDIHDVNSNQNQRKDRLKQLINDLNIDADKIGVTLEDRVNVILTSLISNIDNEFNFLSVSGFSQLLKTLPEHFPSLNKKIKEAFEIEDMENIDTEKLRHLRISPYDILYLLSNDEIKSIRDSMGLSKRGDARLAILESFANATDKLIENYELLAVRDVNQLKKLGIDIAEAEIGVKFEEATKAIFEMLGLSVDEELRKELNTSKEKADIIISLNEDDIIIGEAKTCKSGDFAKYSSTSRQVKSYVNRAENQNKRVVQVLIVAPSFSNDFVESADVDTEVNISLLEAKGLKQILDAYKAKRAPKFTPKLLTKGGLLKADLIAKSI